MNNSKSQLLANNTLIGTLSFDKEFYIYGNFEGTIEGKEGVLFIEEGANFSGKIHTKQLVIKGTFEGYCENVEILTLKKTAFVKANILCKQLIIEEGADFEGNCEIMRD